MALQIRTRPKALTNLYPIRFFSQSPSSDSTTSHPPETDSGADTGNSAQPRQSSSFSSYFSDVRARLKQQENTQQARFTRPPTQSPPPYNNNNSNSHTNQQQVSRVSSLDEIRKNLSEFRRRSAPPSSGSPPVSFHEVYKRSVIAKNDESNSNPNPDPESPVNSKEPLSLNAIRDSLRRLRSSSGSGNRGSDKSQNDPLSLTQFQKTLRLRPDSDPAPPAMEGKDGLPISVFPRGAGDKKDNDTKDTASKTAFVRSYGFRDLGDMLRNLRPAGPAEEWFSLEELNNRLVKLREMEERENELRMKGISFSELRNSLLTLQKTDNEKDAKLSLNRLDIMGALGVTSTYMMQPPKEHLVEKYFHPDNMSSAEKLKIELAKVRDEFKMSESDCGSARVQVAQLTTKIKHLSSVLHKKDKHSRKGLVAMVQQRKKLLKYLRRTDWDSYCLVLDKLGLRDNPVLKG